MYHCGNCLREAKDCNCGDYESVWRGDKSDTLENTIFDVAVAEDNPAPNIPKGTPDEVEKIIPDYLPEIIKERMKEENTKIRIRNKRKSIREMLRR